MFYCDDCAATRKWPTGFNRSVGPCELCKKVTTCTDRASSLLSDPEDVADEPKPEPMRYFLFDLTTGWPYASGPDLGPVAAPWVMLAAKYPGHEFGVLASKDLPFKPVGVAPSQYPALHKLKVHQQQWADVLGPFVDTLRRNGLLGAVTDEELQFLHKEVLGLDVEAAGAEALQQVRDMRAQSKPKDQVVGKGAVLVQKGPAEEIMSPEQLEVWQEQVATVAAVVVDAPAGLTAGVAVGVSEPMQELVAAVVQANAAGQAGNMLGDYKGDAEVATFLHQQPIGFVAGIAARCGVAPELWREYAPAEYAHRYPEAANE